MSNSLTLERRIMRLEARAEIAEIIGAYCVSCDDRDVDRLRSLFTEDAEVLSKDGVMKSSGLDAIMTMYDGRFRALGPTFHWTHDHVVKFDDSDDDTATGFVTGHAECFRNGQTLVAGLRYDDIYRRIGGAWKFKRRMLSFLYYVPVQEYADALGDKLRQRAYGDRRPADFPESLPSWVAGRYAA
ncbi:nuclear transport factor 2 family protein [Terrarubrum flagellatum]|uniref:nuclear transport factor 2 family protein n=1 Tax=Terrirubrum flagellatum TaxID=2895980 RepID=UPI003144EFFE